MMTMQSLVALLLFALIIPITYASEYDAAHQLEELLHINHQHPRYSVIMANLQLEGLVFDAELIEDQTSLLEWLGATLQSDLSRMYTFTKDNEEDTNSISSPRQMNEPLRFDSLNSREFHVIMAMLYDNLTDINPRLLASFFTIYTCHLFGKQGDIYYAIQNVFEFASKAITQIMMLLESSTPMRTIELLSMIRHAMEWCAMGMHENHRHAMTALPKIQFDELSAHWITSEGRIDLKVYWEYKFSQNLIRLKELVDANKIFISEIPHGFHRIISISKDSDLHFKLRDGWFLDRALRQDTQMPAVLLDQLHSASSLEQQMQIVAKWKVWEMMQDYIDVAWNAPPKVFSSWLFIDGSWLKMDVFNKLFKSLWKRHGFKFFAQYIDWRIDLEQAEFMPLEHQPLWHNVLMDIGRGSFHSLAQYCQSSAYMDPWELYSLYRLARYYQSRDSTCQDQSLTNLCGFNSIHALLGQFSSDYYLFGSNWLHIHDSRLFSSSCTFQESAYLLKAARSIDQNIGSFLNEIKCTSLANDVRHLERFFGIDNTLLNVYTMRKIILLYAMVRDKDAINACRLCTSSTPRGTSALLRLVQWKDGIRPSEAIPFTTFFIIYYSMTANIMLSNMSYVANIESCLFHSITRLRVQEQASKSVTIEAIGNLGFSTEKAAGIYDAWQNNYSISSLMPRTAPSQSQLMRQESSKRFTIQPDHKESSSPETVDLHQFSSSNLSSSQNSSSDHLDREDMTI